MQSDGGGDHPMPAAASSAAAARTVRRLPMSDELFVECNLQREALAKQTSTRQPSEDQQQQQQRGGGVASLREDEFEVFECRECHDRLLSAHLLDLHLLEVHDAFFAAQAARRMKCFSAGNTRTTRALRSVAVREQVFRCLVEGCARLFCTPVERRCHLIDHHMYSPAFCFDTLHLGSARATWQRAPEQDRPAAALRRTGMGPGRHWGCSETTVNPETAECSTGSPAPLPAVDRGTSEASGHAMEGGKGSPAVSTSMDVDSITEGVSRLSTAGRGGSAGVPAQVSFGRRGRGAFGQRSRGGRSEVLEGG